MDFGRFFDLPWGVTLLFNMLFWAVFYMGAALLTIKLAFWRIARAQRKLAKASLEDIDRMSGEHFEEYLAVLLERLGYDVTPTGKYDKGADLLLYRDGVRTAVQAKCWRDKPVGVEAVRAVIASQRPYRCERGLVITNGTYTRTAR